MTAKKARLAPLEARDPPPAPALRREPPEAYMRGELDNDHLCSFACGAAAVAVVGGTEFAFHLEVLAQHSKVSGCTPVRGLRSAIPVA